MSNLAVGLVWQRSRAKGSNLLVLLAIADLADDDGRDFWQSNDRLQEKSRLSKRSLHYIVNRLVKDGEIEVEPNVQKRLPKKSRGYVPDRYFHIRCIFDWARFQEEGSAKFALRSKPDRTQSLQRVRAKNRRVLDEKLHSPIRTDLLVDLSMDLKAAAGERRETHPGPEPATYKQLEKLVHEALDNDAFESRADLSDAVKTRASRLRLLYEPAVLARAIESAIVVRGFDRAQSRTGAL